MTYEKASIMKWVDVQKIDPCTKAPLRRRHLSPNLALRGVIENWVATQCASRCALFTHVCLHADIPYKVFPKCCLLALNAMIANLLHPSVPMLGTERSMPCRGITPPSATAAAAASVQTLHPEATSPREPLSLSASASGGGATAAQASQQQQSQQQPPQLQVPAPSGSADVPVAAASGVRTRGGWLLRHRQSARLRDTPDGVRLQSSEILVPAAAAAAAAATQLLNTSADVRHAIRTLAEAAARIDPAPPRPAVDRSLPAQEAGSHSPPVPDALSNGDLRPSAHGADRAAELACTDGVVLRRDPAAPAANAPMLAEASRSLAGAKSW